MIADRAAPSRAALLVAASLIFLSPKLEVLLFSKHAGSARRRSGDHGGSTSSGRGAGALEWPVTWNDRGL
jgi:hypothetical protein